MELGARYVLQLDPQLLESMGIEPMQCREACCKGKNLHQGTLYVLQVYLLTPSHPAWCPVK